MKYKLKFSDSIFESERTLYALGEEFSHENLGQLNTLLN